MVSKRVLLVISALVWMIAGFNVVALRHDGISWVFFRPVHSFNAYYVSAFWVYVSQYGAKKHDQDTFVHTR